MWPVLATALRWRPDLIFAVAPSLMSAALASFAARRAGASSWLHIQDFEVDAAFDLGILTNTRLRGAMVAIERRILGSFDRVSTISPQMLARLEDKGVNAKNIREIRNWTDASLISPGNRNTGFRRDLGLNETHLVGLYSGTMSNKQGLDLIVDAARELEKGEPTVQFILCGDGPHKAKLQAMAAGLSNVHFLGLQAGDQFTALLNTADFHLIPQRAEAADLVLPSKLGGILASGQPVIVMANPGTGLADEVEGAGLIVQPGSSHALADGARRLANDSDLCHSLGKAGRLKALERWDKTKIVRTLDQEFFALGISRGADPQLPASGTSVDRTLEHQAKHPV
jgi:colanic acid biosynthesis glycosyl transferase WcaI